MNKIIYIISTSFVVLGCASTLNGYPVNDTEALNEYDSCLMSVGNDASQCEHVRPFKDHFADDEADYGS